MEFAGSVGVDSNLDVLDCSDSSVEVLFKEEVGAVVQVLESQVSRLVEVFVAHGFESTSIYNIGKVLASPEEQSFTIVHDGNILFSSTRGILQQLWAETSYQMQSIRDDPDCAAEEFALIADPTHRGLAYHLTFTPRPNRSLFHPPNEAVLP